MKWNEKNDNFDDFEKFFNEQDRGTIEEFFALPRRSFIVADNKWPICHMMSEMNIIRMKKERAYLIWRMKNFFIIENDLIVSSVEARPI